MNMGIGESRVSFKSPTAVRKAEPLACKPAQVTSRNNISTARMSRRTRQERKEKIEETKQITKPVPQTAQRRVYINEAPPNIFDNPHEHSLTIAADMMEADCPMPVPVPERFIKPVVDRQFVDFNFKIGDSNLRPDLDDLPI